MGRPTGFGAGNCGARERQPVTTLTALAGSPDPAFIPFRIREGPACLPILQLREPERRSTLIYRKQVSKMKGKSRKSRNASLVVHMKTQMSRFQIHDDLTAPQGSVPVLRGALASGGQLPNFLGVLAGSPAALRAYAKFRSELRHGKLTLATLERIALAVA